MTFIQMVMNISKQYPSFNFCTKSCMQSLEFKRQFYKVLIFLKVYIENIKLIFH